jgi:hypothetical protein
MKYLNKSFFRQLDVIRIVVVVILQVLGVASIWGYSEIFGFRVGYDPNWAFVTVVFMLLSAFRLFVANFEEFHEVFFVKAMVDPAYTMRSLSFADKKKFIVAVIGISFTWFMDFVLQILGTASIWGYSQILGLRQTDDENITWARVTMAFSALSLFRYMSKFSRVFYDLDKLSASFVLIGPFQYFQAGFVASFSAKKVVFHNIFCFFRQMYRQRNYRLNGKLVWTWSREKIIVNETGSISSEETQIAEHECCNSELTIPAAFCFIFGHMLHMSLTFVLEILGSGGATWGSFEVMKLRRSPTSPTFRVIAIMASAMVLTKSCYDFYKKHYKGNRLNRLSELLNQRSVHFNPEWYSGSPSVLKESNDAAIILSPMQNACEQNQTVVEYENQLDEKCCADVAATVISPFGEMLLNETRHSSTISKDKCLAKENYGTLEQIISVDV